MSKRKGIVIQRLGLYPMRNPIRKGKPERWAELVLVLGETKKGNLVRYIYLNARREPDSNLNESISCQISAWSLNKFLENYRSLSPRLPGKPKKIPHTFYDGDVWENLANYRRKWRHYDVWKKEK